MRSRFPAYAHSRACSSVFAAYVAGTVKGQLVAMPACDKKWAIIVAQ